MALRLVYRAHRKAIFSAWGPWEKENLYDQFFVYPLESCKSQDDINKAVETAFAAMEFLCDPSRRKEKLKSMPEDLPKSITIIGVLQLNFHLNWLELEKLGTGVSDKLIDVMLKLKPYYEVLLKYVENS